MDSHEKIKEQIYENTFSRDNTSQNEININKIAIENLKIEISNLENTLNVNSMPSFHEIFSYLIDIQSTHLTRILINNLTQLLIIKNEDNSKKIEFIQKYQRMENEKLTLDRDITRLKKNTLDLNEKVKNLEFQLEGKKREKEEQTRKLKFEILEDQKEIQKLKSRGIQFEYEISKLRKNFDLQNEQLLKVQINTKSGGGASSSKNDVKFSYFSGKNDNLSLSYNLDAGFNYNIFTQNFGNTLNNPKIEFIKDYQKSMDEKYINLIEENKKFKNFLLNLHLKFVKLVNLKKETFLQYYFKTFGTEFPNDKNVPLDAEVNGINISQMNNSLEANIRLKNLEVTFDTELFITTFNNNYTRLEEYLIKNQEFEYLSNFFEDKSSSNEKSNYLNEKLTSNIFKLYESYRVLNSSLYNLTNMKIENKSINSNNDICKNIKTLIGENHTLINNFSDKLTLSMSNGACSLKIGQDVCNNNNDINKIKDSEKNILENYIKFNKNIKEELHEYEKILNSTLNYINN